MHSDQFRGPRGSAKESGTPWEPIAPACQSRNLSEDHGKLPSKGSR
jgi:hypothetical protein